MEMGNAITELVCVALVILEENVNINLLQINVKEMVCPLMEYVNVDLVTKVLIALKHFVSTNVQDMEFV
jgi:hypothetical protein